MPYPVTAPIASGWLEVGDGHALCWEEAGNPNGMPALILHGGPGSGFSPATRRFFDPERYRIIGFDRGHHCGARWLCRLSGRCRPFHENRPRSRG